jgi:putative CocE/NonD family hydrolase
VLIRSAAPVDSPRSPTRAAGHLLAEQGHAAVLQTCRGLHGSEGRFQPFVDEVRDGEDLLAWVAEQPWFQPPLVVAGFGYGAHAAWAALAAESPQVDAIVAGFACRDPYTWLHADRALRLDLALELAVSLSAAEEESPREPDLARALSFRPVREADRVALRRIGWWREWLDHPTRDGYWEERSPEPAQAPAALLIGGFRHPALAGQLEDHRRLAGGASSVRLLLGPWRGERGREGRRERAGFRSELARSVLDFLDALAGGEARRPSSAVRAFVAGERRWRDAPAWPPGEAREYALRLSGDGRAEGGLEEMPAAEASSDVFVYDPADATPQVAEGGRGDLLRYAGRPQEQPLEIAGSPRIVLFAESTAPRTDFVARLVELSAEGEATPIGEGLARDALREAGGQGPRPVEIELEPVWHRLRPGTRLGLEIASAARPAYDAHPNTADAPTRVGDLDGRVARQRVWHGEGFASRVVLPRLVHAEDGAARRETAEDASGPPADADGPEHFDRSATRSIAATPRAGSPLDSP